MERSLVPGEISSRHFVRNPRLLRGKTQDVAAGFEDTDGGCARIYCYMGVFQCGKNVSDLL